MKKIELENFQHILQLNYSFYGGLFFNSKFGITMTFFWVHNFHFLCDKRSVIISKIHNESIFLKNSFIIFNKIFTKVYYNMDNEKIKKLNVWYNFTF
jgi:hypothetical protein